MAHKTYEELQNIVLSVSDKIKVGRRYSHYKNPNDYYVVLGLSLREEDESPSVRYRPLYTSGKLDWNRASSEWLRPAQVDGTEVPRFQLSNIPYQVSTLVYLLNEDKVCLGFSKKSGFGGGLYNGFGGKVNESESIKDCAVREVYEESGVEISTKDLVCRGKINYIEPDKDWEVHIFVVDDVDLKTPVETNEMKPEWFDIHKLPSHHMWSDDMSWLPHVLVGKEVSGVILHDADYNPTYIEVNLVS